MNARFSALLSLAALAAVSLGLSALPAQADQPLAVTETPTASATAPVAPSATPLPSLTAPVPPAIVDPLITKRVSLERAVVGDRADFTITVTNPNDVAVLNVVVTDPLPAQVDFLAGATTAGTLTYDSASRTVTVVIGTLAARQVVTITLQTRVNQTGRAPDLVINTAQLAFSNLTGQGFLVSSPTVNFQLIPGELPASGYGPGPRELLGLWAAGGLLLALLAGVAARAWGRRRS